MSARFIQIAALAGVVAASAGAVAARDDGPRMEITRKADQTSTEGSPAYFTGKVTIGAQFQRPPPSRP